MSLEGLTGPIPVRSPAAALGDLSHLSWNFADCPRWLSLALLSIDVEDSSKSLPFSCSILTCDAHLSSAICHNRPHGRLTFCVPFQGHAGTFHVCHLETKDSLEKLNSHPTSVQSGCAKEILLWLPQGWCKNSSGTPNVE